MTEPVQCEDKCRDNNSYCSAWAGRGECRKNSEYMDIYCRKVSTACCCSLLSPHIFRRVESAGGPSKTTPHSHRAVRARIVKRNLTETSLLCWLDTQSEYRVLILLYLNIINRQLSLASFYSSNFW